MTDDRAAPPTWFWMAGIAILLWALLGAVAFYFHISIDDAALAKMSAYDRSYFQRLPFWFSWVFALAIVPSLLGAIALLMRSRVARLLFLVSLAGVILQFGYVFGGTDLIAVKGAAETVPFPALILLIGIVQLWLAGVFVKRGWLR